MEMIIQDGGKTIDELQVASGSHVYIKQGETDLFIAWNDLPTEAREACAIAMQTAKAALDGAAAAVLFRHEE